PFFLSFGDLDDKATAISVKLEGQQIDLFFDPPEVRKRAGETALTQRGNYELLQSRIDIFASAHLFAQTL
ncbi:MAG TPA: hypothetical protein VG742_20285, partial [Dongiaceae bacterium]|nr:hypothetical protein [Dongiaceae bacterium]